MREMECVSVSVSVNVSMSECVCVCERERECVCECVSVSVSTSSHSSLKKISSSYDGSVKGKYASIHLPKQTQIQEQLPYRNALRFQGGLVFKAHRRVYHSILGLSVIKKKDTHRCDFLFRDHHSAAACAQALSH